MYITIPAKSFFFLLCLISYSYQIINRLFFDTLYNTYSEIIRPILPISVFPLNSKGAVTPFPNSDEGMTQTKTPHNEKVETYTKTSSKNTPNTSTQSSSTTLEDENLASVVAEAQELFKDFGLPEKDIDPLAKLPGNGMDWISLRIKL